MKKDRAPLAVGFGAVVGVVNAFRPLSRRGLSSLPAYVFGVLFSELSLLLAAALPVAEAIASRGASPRSRRLGWLLSGIAMAGLLALDRAGRRSREPLKAALDDALGPNRPQDLSHIWIEPEASPAKRPGLVRMTTIHRHYGHATDVGYGEHGKANTLDIWRLPELDPTRPAPVLLQVPGGAWSTGNKRGQAHPLMSHLTDLGWICVSINYRLSPRHTWPAHIVDVKRAIAWVKDNIADYGGDPDFVAITGGSAGGHLSALAALTPNDPAFQPGFADSDTRVQAAVPFYGVYDFTYPDGVLHNIMLPFLERLVMKSPKAASPDVFAAASPATYVGPDAPPFFILHGRNDAFIPVEQARRFATRLRTVSRQPVAYAELPIAEHAFDIFASPRAEHSAVAVGEFLASVYREATTGATLAAERRL